MILNNLRVKIFLSLVLAFGVVSMFSNVIFENDTPIVRKDAPSRVASIPRNMLNNVIGVYRTQFVAKSLENKLKDQPLIPVASGVYAKTSSEGSLNYIDIENMKIEVQNARASNGEVVQVIVPQGENISQELIDYLATHR